MIHDLKPEEKACGSCGGFLSLIGHETREQLDIVIKFIVKCHKRLKYACRCCGDTIRLAPEPCQAIEKSLASAPLLAHVLVDKYADHLPLYRQQQRFLRSGIALSRATLWNWVKLSAASLEPLVEAMKQDLLVVGHIFSDDTVMPTLRPHLKENKGMAAQNNYMWVYAGLSQEAPFHPIVLYDFTSGRGAEYPSSFLETFEGYLQTDAYSGYLPFVKTHENVISLGCWAHVRRKFFDALEANPHSIAKEMLDKIALLYALEKKMKEEQLSLADIALERQKKAAPILEEIYKWLELYKPQTAPKSLLGKAISYALSQWSTLTPYIKEGRLEIDNNRSERCIKSIVIGRKNYLFMGSERGGQAAATLYSLIETCKQNNVDPLAYLADVLEKIPTYPNKKIKDLLPYNWKQINNNILQNSDPPQKVA